MLSQNVDPMLAGFAGVGVAAPAGGETPGRAVRQIRRFSPLPARAAFGRPFCMDGREPCRSIRQISPRLDSRAHLTRGRRSAICRAMADVSFPAAFGAGLLSFVSPCVLPLAAPYLCFLAGASVEALADESETKARRDILITAVLFVAGFSTVFVGLGATASALGSVLRQWSHALSIAAGIGVILMGLHFLGLFKIGAMLREKRLEIEKPAGLWSAYPMGFAFALGWTPCIGPILATILAVAGSRDTVASGAALLAVYSLGLGLPFIAAAAAIGPFIRASRHLRAQFGRIEKAVGVLLVATGVAFLTGGFQSMSLWLIETFPQFGQIG
jgi:cytochrome c-type biogenesis protein